MKLLPVVMSLAMISGPALLAQSGSGSTTQAAPPQASKENTPPTPAEMKLVPVAPLQ